ncbi:uncharacterized protein PHALS_03149 [Plasmopara halstedii]|uniref:Uncharacterized protein n=1 Tax=Plasmopara halstedii TaxID=4781 RepID=A0A0P1A7K7_PLAHL|nr:uncharacterized protein PHALS_03149 [Plasmopara halstedii]CEG36604.1 hypothetical protein PHALS_03149 [Plasmopara halstedii]|eukprot:XP_024572973.1 hypothetical protein PHALS_03149 [Plasmopara halstedii]
MVSKFIGPSQTFIMTLFGPKPGVKVGLIRVTTNTLEVRYAEDIRYRDFFTVGATGK